MKNEDFEKAYNSCVMEGFDQEGKYKEKMRELYRSDMPIEKKLEIIRKMVGVDEETLNVLSDPTLMKQIK